MYAPSFGNYQGGQAPPTFNQAGPPQQPHQQHMMFNNAQQFPGAAPPHANPYGGNPNQMNPNMMMPNGGMMQNGGMAHMSGGNGLGTLYKLLFCHLPMLRRVLSLMVSPTLHATILNA